MGLAGPAVSLVPLILAKNSCGLGMAVACLTAFMGLQAFAYSGFHAYVQARPGWALSFCNYLSLSLFDVQSCSPLQTSCSNIFNRACLSRWCNVCTRRRAKHT